MALPDKPLQEHGDAAERSLELRCADDGMLRAAKLGNLEEIEGWMAAGASPGAVEWNSGRDALMIAIDRGHLDIVERLARVCRLDAVDKLGRDCVDAARDNAGEDLAKWLESARAAQRERAELGLVSRAGSGPGPNRRL